MRLFVTGATGVLGREAIPELISRGHEVDALVRRTAAEAALRAAGARPVRLDLFGRDAVHRAVARVDGIVHLATAIPPLARMARRRAWRTTDRLRDDVTGNIVDAAISTGAQVVIFPSITFNYADGGSDWLGEDAPLAAPFGATESALLGETHVARLTEAGGRGISLRMGRFYGPGDATAEQVQQARARGPIVIGSGDNFVSSVHVADAGAAIAGAVTAPAGTYNVVDDVPRTAAELAAAQTAGLDTRPPRHLPAWLARLVVGRASRLLTTSQRVSNQRFKDTTGWAPVHADAAAWWRQHDDRRVAGVRTGAADTADQENLG